MDEQSAKRRIEELREEIARHDRYYRIDNSPKISDDDFDLLVRELRSLESEFPRFRVPDSPTERVGSDSSEGFKSVGHLSPMLSLDNVFDTSELEDFDSRLRKILGKEGDLDYCVEPKIDGAGISAVYENGKLSRLLTRGDGESGDDITCNAFVIKNLPLKLSGNSFPKLLEIRGECYMERGEFERIREEARREYEARELSKARERDFFSDSSPAVDFSEIERKLPSNPRNLAAGTMKLLDRSVLEKRSLKAIFYSIGASEGFVFERQSDLPGILEGLGLPAVNWFGTAKGSKGAFEKICELEEVRSEFPFDTDGAVVKLDDCSLHAKAGMTSHSPRWAVAWKYRAKRAKTKLLSITIQVGRTGAVTPVAELEPIRLSGTMVARATLHNAGYISEKDIRVGDEVVVEKAGEIIPAVIEPVAESRGPESVPFEFPTHCPECGTLLKRYGEKMLYRCPNAECPPQIVERLSHFASRDCMDIRGLGDKTVGQLVEHLGVRDFADIYSLTREKILSLKEFEKKSADNLVKSIEDSKNRELWRLIFGLGILEIGERFAKILAKRFGSLDALMGASAEEISAIDGFGGASKNSSSVRALSIRAFFDDPHNAETIEKLRKAGLNFKDSSETLFNPSVQKSPFFGKSFAITGTLESMGRSRAKTLIENFGGRISSSVTKGTDALIAAKGSNGSKMRSAQEFGTRIISEGEFLEMLESSEKLAGGIEGESEQMTLF